MTQIYITKITSGIDPHSYQATNTVAKKAQKKIYL